MQMTPYLSFNGKCESAFRFYEKALGGRMIMMMRYGESPAAAQTSPDFSRQDHARPARGRGRIVDGLRRAAADV